MRRRGARPGRALLRSSRANGQRRQRTIVVGAVVVIAAVLVVIGALRLSGVTGPSATSDTALSATVISEVTSVSPAVLRSAGAGDAPTTLHWLPGPTRLGDHGKPLLIYEGAEYCPFCAVERWPLIVAMSRFGTFKDLQPARSSPEETLPNTPSFSFAGASYDSPYLEFSAVEVQSSVKAGNTYAPLETPTALQQEVFQRFNGPPFLPASQAGGIPFIDIADRFLVNGATYDPRVLNRLSRDVIASRLRTVDSDPSRPILGAANVLIATICVATANVPADVCQDGLIQQIVATLPKAPTG